MAEGIAERGCNDQIFTEQRSTSIILIYAGQTDLAVSLMGQMHVDFKQQTNQKKENGYQIIYTRCCVLYGHDTIYGTNR
ncbi:MAG: hypothetical protein CM15mV134_230 [uncultured marine virus]|nr:MAG: hypothetical protein CM15mV134_230 [uncultured marine virus]